MCEPRGEHVFDLPAAAMMTFPLAVVTCHIPDCGSGGGRQGVRQESRLASPPRRLSSRDPVLAALTIQKHARCFLLRSRFLRLKRGVIRLQAMVRGVLLRMRIRRWHASATTIQRRYRGYRRARTQRVQFINTRKAVLLIQNEWREWKRRQGVQYTW